MLVVVQGATFTKATKQLTQNVACDILQNRPIIMLLISVAGRGYRWIGYRPVRRRLVDTARFWTMVDKRPFRRNGIVNRIQLYARFARRPLRVGIYRPTRRGYRLVRQVQFNRLRKGLNRVSISKWYSFKYHAFLRYDSEQNKQYIWYLRDTKTS